MIQLCFCRFCFIYIPILWWECLERSFYPRPVLASPRIVWAYGYCRCLRLCVYQSVCQSLACPRDNSGSVQARITKFGPEAQHNLVKFPIVLWSDRPWSSRSNWRSTSKFTPFWACLYHNLSCIQARITKFGPEVQYTFFKIPIVFFFTFFFFWGGGRLTLTFKVKFILRRYMIHNHHITTQRAMST